LIPRAAITEWANKVPWEDMHNVEQDLIIGRSLVAIFCDDTLSAKLAFRGGTALHKLYLPPPSRYSEDIDLVQIEAEPIGAILDRIKDALSFLGIAKTKTKVSNNVLLFQFETTFPPIVTRRLKIEINCKEHFTVMGQVKVPFRIESQWFTGNCYISTYTLDELIGTKIRALYQRRKGRDLFDLYRALESGKLNVQNALNCFRQYIAFPDLTVPSQKEYALNLKLKMSKPDFRNDIAPIISPDISYDIDKAYKEVLGVIVAVM
jgi:predicted nucleotidyltransferase component of viral defense system